MSFSTYEPSTMEIRLTLALGLSLLSPYYRGFVRRLELRGNEQVLDFGSGSGICSRHIAARLERGGGKLDCVDISRGWMRVVRHTLRKYDNVAYHLGHISQVLIPDASIDAIVIHFVLHDIPFQERSLVLEHLARKLKPGGRLLLREPRGEGLELLELCQLSSANGLSAQTIAPRDVLIGAVYDGVFVKR